MLTNVSNKKRPELNFDIICHPKTLKIKAISQNNKPAFAILKLIY